MNFRSLGNGVWTGKGNPEGQLDLPFNALFIDELTKFQYRKLTYGGTRTGWSRVSGGEKGEKGDAGATGATGSGGAAGSPGPQLPRVMGVTVDGGGIVLTPGVKGYLTIPFNGTLTGWLISANQAGTIQFDVLRISSGEIAPTASIVGSNPPVMVADQFQSGDVTGWDADLFDGDIFGFVIDSVATITQCTLSLKLVPAP